MDEHEFRMKLFAINREIASLRYEYSEVFNDNTVLAIKLYGYRASFPNRFDDEILEKMSFYIRAGR